MANETQRSAWSIICLMMAEATGRRAESDAGGRAIVTRRPSLPAALGTTRMLCTSGRGPDCRAELAQYYESAPRVDQELGRLVEILKKAGKYDDALILFISDRGIASLGAACR